MLGLINYYAKFIPNLAAVLHPLHDLLRASKPWSWSRKCQKAFEEAKQRLTSAPVLAHYDPKLPIQLAGDTSLYGVRAVISHIMPDGSERPVAYASRTLTATECNYAQVEKEALSLICLHHEIPPISLWETFHSNHGPQATDCHTGAKKRCSPPGCCSYAAMGIVTVRLL